MKTIAYIVAVVKFQEKYLLLKRSEDAELSPGEWEFISGSFDTPETGEEILHRELSEEAGQTGQIVGTGKTFEYMEGETRWVVVPYLVVTDNQDVRLDGKEHVEYKWVDRNEIAEFDRINGDNYLEMICEKLNI